MESPRKISCMYNSRLIVVVRSKNFFLSIENSGANLARVVRYSCKTCINWIFRSVG